MTDSSEACPFCSSKSVTTVAENSSCIALRDAFPVSEGHTLIIPRRHVAAFTDLSITEKRDLLDLVDVIRADLDASRSPDGYNIGLNDGMAAGQTVMHLHLHVIPRYLGDIADPRGGIRWVLPERAQYWESET